MPSSLIDGNYFCVYNCTMYFEWDENKRLRNLEKHGVDFVTAYRLWEAPMVVVQDTRFNYGEPRWIGVGRLEGRVMVVAFTKRAETIRLISYRKANQREVIFYEQRTKGR